MYEDFDNQQYKRERINSQSRYGFTYSDGNYYNSGNTGYNYDYNGANTPQNNEPPKREKKKGKGGFIALVALVAAISAIAGSFLTGYFALPLMLKNQQSAAAELNEQTTLTSAQNTDLDSNEVASIGSSMNNPVPQIAEQVRNSVVSIVIYEKTLIPGQEPVEEKIASGSGFVISEDGYILTNAHVVEEGNLFKINTQSGEEYVAQLIGKDTDTELAVLKVDNLGLPAVSIGDSNNVKTGDFVVAIGSPVDSETLHNTVTVGYVSSESRDMTLHGSNTHMIQTDAAINPGNSGGPLLNDRGEVIGINTMKTMFVGMDEYGNTISAEGIGFALPISEAMDTVELLIKDGGIVKPGIGFTYSPVTAEDAELWDSPRGIIIQSVNPGSPAAEAGLQPYDIIIEIDGVDLTVEGAEVPKFNERELGDSIDAVVWRDGTEYSVTFILDDLNKL